MIWVGIKGRAHPNLCNNHVHQPAARNLGPYNQSGPPVSGRLGVNYFPYNPVARIADLLTPATVQGRTRRKRPARPESSELSLPTGGTVPASKRRPIMKLGGLRLAPSEIFTDDGTPVDAYVLVPASE